MQPNKYEERIRRGITVLTLFGPNSRPNLLWSGDQAFHACFRRFSTLFKGRSLWPTGLSTVSYWYLEVEPETDTGFLTTFRHQTGLVPADLEERDGMWAWQVRKLPMYMWTSLNASQVSRVQSIENKIMPNRFVTNISKNGWLRESQVFFLSHISKHFFQRCNIKVPLFLQFFEEKEVGPFPMELYPRMSRHFSKIHQITHNQSDENSEDIKYNTQTRNSKETYIIIG